MSMSLLSSRSVVVVLLLGALGCGSPPADAGPDRDGDGLSDAVERAGWSIQVDFLGLGVEQMQLEIRSVTSDPSRADTDGDGLDDGLEYQLRTDPRRVDGDGDGLGDADEVLRWRTSAVSADTDGDATGPDGLRPPDPRLFDGAEITGPRTSPTLADTDGDGRTDFEELDNPIRSPLIAELPRLEVSFAGELDVRLRVTYAESEGTESTYGSEFSTTQTDSTTRSDTTSTAVTVAADSGGEGFFHGIVEGFASGGRGGALAGAITTIGGPALDLGRDALCDAIGQEDGVDPPRYEGGATESFLGGLETVGNAFGAAYEGIGACDEATPETTTTNTTTLTTESATAATESYSEYLTESRVRTETVASGEVRVGAEITNTSPFTVSLSNLFITMMLWDQSPDPNLAIGRGGFRTLATLQPVVSGNFVLGPGETSPVVELAANDVNPSIVKSFLRNPRAIFYSPAGFELDNEDGIDFRFLTEETLSRTGNLVLDFGDGRIERFQVATNVDRVSREAAEADPALVAGEPEGVLLTELLERTLGVPFETVMVDHDGLEETPPIQRLESLGGLANDWPESAGELPATADGTPGAPSGFWMLHTSAAIEDPAAVDLATFRIGRAESVRLIYLRDRDGDGLFDREEAVYGTDDRPTDELDNGTFVAGAAFGTADGVPDGVDSDRDGLTDYQEVKVGWRVCIALADGTPCPATGEPVPDGFPIYQAYADPTRLDADGDGLLDLEERDLGTDPANDDTDDDGLADDVDPYPLIPATTLYVDGEAAGAGTGGSWPDALTDLNGALALAAARNGNGEAEPYDDVSQIWIAGGVYTPSADDRSASFVLPSRVALLGGFVGDERTLAERSANPLVTATVLSGDLLGDDIGSVSGGNTLRGDNAFTVVTVPAGAVDVVLDGVTIVGGQANGYADSDEFRDRAADRLDPQISGGGVQCLGQATLRRVDLRGNLAAFGGAMAANGDCAVLDSRITGNRSRAPNISVTLYGSGVFQAGGALRIEDTEILDNNGDLPGFSGGGVAILDGTLDVDGAVFRDNRTGGDTSRGGGLCAIGGRVRVGSSVFRDNEGVRGAAIFAGRGPGGTAGQVIAEQILVHDNDSSEGGALHAAGGPRGATQVVLRISYATVADNTVAVQGDRSAVVLLQNSIVFGNTQDLRSGIFPTEGGRFDVLFTVLSSFRSGDGNISSADPGFVSRQLRDYRLTAASPAVDAGNRLLDTDGFLEGLQVPELDFAGLPRLVDGDGDGELEVDMGAFELPGSG